MTPRKTLKDHSIDELEGELDARWAEEHFQPGMTMSQMELLVWRARGMENPAALRLIRALLSRVKREAVSGKPCPKCRARTPVKARDRERTIRTMAGPVTLKRNYHYCQKCQSGFYPLDQLLELPEDGELTAEMEKRVLDFAVTDVYGDAAERWNVHYLQPISDNLLRRVVCRVGTQCEEANQARLQEELRPAAAQSADVLVVQVDGSQLPIRGGEPWKEAKVGVIYRHAPEVNRPVPSSSRYVAVVGCLDEFAPVLQDALAVEDVDEAGSVVWIADGAPYNWTLADQLLPDATQILDWYHAVENAMVCARSLLGEESPMLSRWKATVETLLARGEVETLIRELLDCMVLVPRGRGGSRDALEALNTLVGYFRTNIHRMKYSLFREHGLPIGSGAVESAHRHVLQTRMKRAGQRWELANARRMARLRAACRTAGPACFHQAIRRAHRDTAEGRVPPRLHRDRFRWARYGNRDRERSASVRSN